MFSHVSIGACVRQPTQTCCAAHAALTSAVGDDWSAYERTTLALRRGVSVLKAGLRASVGVGRPAIPEVVCLKDIVLRGATPVDAAALAATIAAAFEEYRGRLNPPSAAFGETSARIASELKRGSGAIIALRGGTAIGCVMTKHVCRDLYFGRLSVVPAARGLGLSGRLVAAVEEAARAQELAGVRLGVRIALPANQRLFASLGYVEISREAHPGFDRPTSITMRKAL